MKRCPPDFLWARTSRRQTARVPPGKRRLSASLFCADSKNDPFSRRYQTQPRTPPPGTPAPGFGKTFREKTPARFPFRRESDPGRGASANVPSLDQAPPKRSPFDVNLPSTGRRQTSNVSPEKETCLHSFSAWIREAHPFPLRNQGRTRIPVLGKPVPDSGKTFREKIPARFPFQRESGPGRGAPANVPSLGQAPPKRSSSVQIFHRQRSGSPAAFCRKSKAAEAGSARCESSISRGGRPATFHRESKFTETAPLDANFPSAEKRQTEAVHRESKPTKAAPSRRNFQIDEGAITRQRSAAGQAIPQPHPARTEPAPESNPFFPPEWKFHAGTAPNLHPNATLIPPPERRPDPRPGTRKTRPGLWGEPPRKGSWP